MNGSPDISSVASPAGDDDHFDPADAAGLISSTQRRARRELDPRPPLVGLVLAGFILVIYGSLWWSVRGQHPYVGPSGTVVIWVYAIVAISIAVSVTAYRRATAGVHGRSRRGDTMAALAVGVPWIAVYVFDGALQADGFGANLVYGVFDAAGPWLVVGTGIAAVAAGREKWGQLAGGLVVVAVATGAAFAGPIGCWGVLAVAGFLGLAALAVGQYAHQRLA